MDDKMIIYELQVDSKRYFNLYPFHKDCIFRKYELPNGYKIDKGYFGQTLIFNENNKVCSLINNNNRPAIKDHNIILLKEFSN